MMIPEDGCLRPITTSDLNAFNNIMVVKVNNLKAPGESTFQLATLDRSKKGTVWPADDYISKLIPGLPENKICDEHTKASESRKELNLSIKTTTIRPKLFHQPDQSKYHFTGTRKPTLAGRKNWPDRSKNYKTRFQSNPETDNIEPWLHPWEIQLCAPPDGSRNRNSLFGTPSDRHFNLPNIVFPPPVDRPSLLGPPPSSSGSFQNVYPEDHSPKFNSYNTPRQNLRNRPNASRHYKNNYPRNASTRGSRHDSSLVEPYNTYMEAGRGDSATNFMYEHGNSANNNIGRIPHNSLHENHVPDSRRDPPHSSFEAKYVDQEMDDSVAFNNVGMRRNNSNTSYQTQYRTQNRKQWRNKTQFANPRGNINSSNSRDNVDSFNSRENVNSISRGNRSSLKFRGGRNSMQRHNVYNKNQRGPWIVNKSENFKRPGYRGNRQKAYQNFRGSNA